MAVVYFYIPVEKTDDIVECGLKLSEWKDRDQETPWSCGLQPCFCARLHPDDDKRSRDSAYQCIKINIPAQDCVIADGDLHNLSMDYPELKQKYIDTMVPLNNYLFGSFRNPECLIFKTILGEQISVYGKGLDDPILYENSETLYVNNLLERFNDRYSGINQVLLYSFLLAQSQSGLIEGLYSNSKELAYFFDKEANRHVTITMPELKKYKLGLI